MLDENQVSGIVEKTAKSAFGKDNVVRVFKDNVVRVFTEPGIDAEGHDALRITIVITSDAVDKIDDDALLDNLLNVHDRLRDYNEERTPMVGYATEDELAESGDPEP